MGNIIKTDPYIPVYAYEKQQNPNAPIVWRQFERSVVDDVDRIVELAHGNRDEITLESDWEVFEELLKFYSKRWPQEFKEFCQSVKEIRRTRSYKGYSKSKEMMYVGSIPERFMRIVKVVFPKQQFDKKFIWKMVKRYKIFKVGGE